MRELYIQAGRPRPLYRAYRLEQKLGLKKVRIYYKREDLSPTGSHKVNTAIPQAYYAAKEGKRVLVTETGAGQWGTALAYAASMMGLSTIVFWVRAAIDEAKAAESKGEEKCILINISGHGFLDIDAYREILRIGN